MSGWGMVILFSMYCYSVIPAQAGIQVLFNTRCIAAVHGATRIGWTRIPGYTGMTGLEGSMFDY